jgi:hypothetical protein
VRRVRRRPAPIARAAICAWPGIVVVPFDLPRGRGNPRLGGMASWPRMLRRPVRLRCVPLMAVRLRVAGLRVREGINTWTPIKLFSKPPHNCWKRASRVRNTSHFKLPLSSFVQKLWCQSCLLQNFASQQSMLIITVLHTCNLSQSKLMCAIKGVCGALIYRGVQIPR